LRFPLMAEFINIIAGLIDLNQDPNVFWILRTLIYKDFSEKSAFRYVIFYIYCGFAFTQAIKSNEKVNSNRAFTGSCITSEL
jgi:hypothetical protein